MARKTFIGNAFISITGDKKGLDAVLFQIRGSMQKLGKELQAIGLKMMAAGAAIQAPLTLAVRQFAKIGSEMAHASERAGMLTNEFTELAYAAKLSGSGPEALEKSLIVMQKNVYALRQGAGPAVKAFQALGVTAKDLKGLSIAQQFELLADKLSAIEDPGTKAALALKVFGKGGAGLLPMFNLGAAGIRQYREEAKRMGRSLGPDMADRAERLDKMIERLGETFTGLTMTVGGILAEGFTKALTYLTNLVANIREYLENNPQVVTAIQQVAIGLMAVGAALVGLGTASRVLSYLVSPGGVLLALAGILVYVSGALDPLIEKWGEMVMSFEVGGKTIRQWLELVKESFGDIWQAFKDALAQLQPALKPALTAIKWLLDSIWQQVQVGLMTLKLWLVDQITQLIDMIQKALLGVMNSKGGGPAGAIARSTAKGYSGILSDITGSLESGRVKDASWLVKQREIAAGARKETGAAFTTAGQAIGGSFGGAFGSLKSSFGALGSKWSTALSPLMETIFGSRTKADLKQYLKETGGVPGGASVSFEEWRKTRKRGFLDIFTGLGDPFAVPPTPKPKITPGPALQAAFATSGTFSGLGARQMAGNENPLIRIGNKQLRVLEEIRDNIGEGGGIGGEDFSGGA